MRRHGITEFLDLTKNDREIFFKISPLLLAVLDDRGNVVRINPAFERDLGRSEADVLHHNIVAYVVGKDVDVFLHAFIHPLPSKLFGLLHAGHGVVPARLVAYHFIRSGDDQRGWLCFQKAIEHESLLDLRGMLNWSA